MIAGAANPPSPAMKVEPHEAGPYEGPVPDRLILAAAERAARHSRYAAREVTHSKIAEHLGFERTGATTRKLRPQLLALLEDGSLTRTTHGGKLTDVWALTGRGRGRLAAARRHGQLEPLPESPQHRHWRQARGEAASRLPAIHEAAVDVVEEALDYFASRAESRPPGSAHVFGLARRLEWQLCRFGAATHCLHEWPEPDDAHRDRKSRSVFELRKAEPR